MKLFNRTEFIVIDISPIIAALIMVGGMLLTDFNKPQPFTAAVFFIAAWFLFKPSFLKDRRKNEQKQSEE